MQAVYPNAEKCRHKLIRFGVPEKLLQNENLDFILLLDRLKPLLKLGQEFTEEWQINCLGLTDWKFPDNIHADKLRDNLGAAPAHYLAWKGNVDILEHLSKTQLFELKSNNASTPIHYAALSGNLERLKQIQKIYPEALEKLKNINEATPIHYGAWSGNIEVLDWLRKEYPEAFQSLKINNGTVPLHYAAFSGKTKALNLLRKEYREQFENLKTKNGSTPCCFAAFSGNINFLKLMHKKDAKRLIKPIDNNDATLLHYAAMSCDPDVLDWLLKEYPKDLEELKNKQGSVPLHYAIKSGNVPVLEWVQEKVPKAFGDLKTKEGATALHYGAWSGHVKIVHWMQTRYPVDFVSLMDNFGLTPRHYLALSGNAEALNIGLGLSNTWDVTPNRREKNKKILKTLENALKTNFHLTRIDNLPEDAEIINNFLQRNREIKTVKIQFISFLRGIFQKSNSPYSNFKTTTEAHLAILNQLLPEGIETENVFAIYESIKLDIHKPRAPNDEFFGLDKEHQSSPPSKLEKNKRKEFIDQTISLFDTYNQDSSKFLGGLFFGASHDPGSVNQCRKRLQTLVSEGKILMAFIEIQHHSIQFQKIRNSTKGYFTKLLTQDDEFPVILTKLRQNLAMTYPLFESLAQSFFEHLDIYPEMTMEIGRQIQQLIFKNDFNNLSDKFQELQKHPYCRPETSLFYELLDSALQQYQSAIQPISAITHKPA